MFTVTLANPLLVPLSIDEISLIAEGVPITSQCAAFILPKQSPNYEVSVELKPLQSGKNGSYFAALLHACCGSQIKCSLSLSLSCFLHGTQLLCK